MNPADTVPVQRPSLALLGAEPFRAAYELARHHTVVRQVITIGTPFNSEVDHTNVGWPFRLLSGGSAEFDPALSLRLRTPPPLHTTSIYSRTDGVVAWQTCRHEKRSSRVQDIEVSGSHIGMGWNTEVLNAVTQALHASSQPRTGPMGATPSPSPTLTPTLTPNQDHR